MIQREVRCRGVADRAERGPYRGNDRVVVWNGSVVGALRTARSAVPTGATIGW